MDCESGGQDDSEEGDEGDEDEEVDVEEKEQLQEGEEEDNSDDDLDDEEDGEEDNEKEQQVEQCEDNQPIAMETDDSHLQSHENTAIDTRDGNNKNIAAITGSCMKSPAENRSSLTPHAVKKPNQS